MDLPPTLLPGLGISCPERLAVLAVVSHLTVGFSYLSLTGISDAWARRWRLEIGTGAAAAAFAAIVWTLLVVLWPLPLACRTIRSLRGRLRTARALVAPWCQPTLAVPNARMSSAPIPAKPAEPPVPPRWYREEYMAVHVALAEGRTVVARTWASGLVDDAVIAFGAAHPYTRDAWFLLARVVRTALAEFRGTVPNTDAQPAQDPFDTFLFPHGHHTVAWDADRASVYVANGREQTAAVAR